MGVVSTCPGRVVSLIGLILPQLGGNGGMGGEWCDRVLGGLPGSQESGLE